MTKKYFKLLELHVLDSFHHTHDTDDEFAPLIGRVFDVFEDDGESPWIGFEGKLVGKTLGAWDDGWYVFSYARVEEVPAPSELEEE